MPVKRRRDSSVGHRYLLLRIARHATRSDLAITILVMVSAFLTSSSPNGASNSEGTTSIAGARLERPFVVIDGTANDVRVVTAINGERVDAFTPVNLPTVVAIDVGSPRDHVEVVVENTSKTGITSCEIGTQGNVLVSVTSSSASNAACAATLPHSR